MNLNKATLGQLLFLARHTEYRKLALAELEVRRNGYMRSVQAGTKSGE